MTNAWRIDSIVPAKMVADAAGNPFLNGLCYEVSMRFQDGSYTVTVVMTSWAATEAEQILHTSNLEDLIRSYVLDEIECGWRPDHCPWLTIDSHNVVDLLDQKACESTR